MQPTRLPTDDSAVSPVVGVGLAVLLAGVVGTLVLGLGQSVGTTPQASFAFDWNASDRNVTVVHTGGDRLVHGENTRTVRLTADAAAAGERAWVDDGTDGTTSIGAGDGVEYDYAAPGATVFVSWTGPNNESSVTLGRRQAPR